MNDNIKQKNIFGDNMFNSKKTIFTKHRVQGFFAGVFASLLATLIYEFLIKPNL